MTNDPDVNAAVAEEPYGVVDPDLAANVGLSAAEYEMRAGVAMAIAAATEARSDGERYMLRAAHNYALIAISQRLAEIFDLLNERLER